MLLDSEFRYPSNGHAFLYKSINLKILKTCLKVNNRFQSRTCNGNSLKTLVCNLNTCDCVYCILISRTAITLRVYKMVPFVHSQSYRPIRGHLEPPQGHFETHWRSRATKYQVGSVLLLCKMIYMCLPKLQA